MNMNEISHLLKTDKPARRMAFFAIDATEVSANSQAADLQVEIIFAANYIEATGIAETDLNMVTPLTFPVANFKAECPGKQFRRYIIRLIESWKIRYQP